MPRENADDALKLARWTSNQMFDHASREMSHLQDDDIMMALLASAAAFAHAAGFCPMQVHLMLDSVSNGMVADAVIPEAKAVEAASKNGAN